ncbi:PIN domain-containing protein [Actinomyces sp. B33]|uniref:PIN domain-containing protein n=1 Tax=Actinomyces sp. B33 TaxID=2942131 RepID=UPI002340DD44|nr:PIN domain-containing protein [Actinomyces sp. B33]MDC4233904.1 PIN domain-containing protein [Actinomyces sp. B33]
MRREQRVLVDTNVWYSRTLRDWICLLALHGGSDIYTVIWTDDILAELQYSLRRKYPQLEGGKIAILREKIEETFPDGRIRDYSIDVDGPDPLDGHVRGAARSGEADYVVTCNTKDFNGDDLPYEVYTPDEFFLLVHASSPDVVERAARVYDAYYESSGHDYLVAERLRSAGACGFAKIVASILSRG